MTRRKVILVRFPKGDTEVSVKYLLSRWLVTGNITPLLRVDAKVLFQMPPIRPLLPFVFVSYFFSFPLLTPVTMAS